MKTHILSLFLLFSLSSHAGVAILSDLDDTIKITNAGSILEANYNGLANQTYFTGMPEFMRAGRKHAEALYILSASPGFIEPIIRSTLKKNQIPFDGLILKSTTGLLSSTLRFKVKAIQKLMRTTQHDFVLYGDDVNHDPEVYMEIMKEFPNRVLAAYIHVVKGRRIEGDLADKIVRYFGAYELAVREKLAGRLEGDDVDQVLKVILNEEKAGRLIPKFAQCPEPKVSFEWMERVLSANEILVYAEKMASACGRRELVSQ